MLTSHVGDAGVASAQPFDCFAAIATARSFAADGAGAAPQSRQFSFKVARIRFAISIRGCEERLQPDINPDLRIRTRGNLNVAYREAGSESNLPGKPWLQTD